MKPRLLAALTVLAAALLAPLSTAATAESGIARGVNQQASAGLPGSIRQLRVGSDVSIGETVTTNASGLVQLLFRDNSKLVVGPNSSLVIEDYLIRDDNSAGKFAVNTLSGTFRFLTGTAPKGSYLIKTPTGTIGVRGTGLEWSIVPRQLPDLIPPANLSTLVLLLEGSIRICNLANRCADVSDICDFGAVNAGGAVAIDNTRESRTAFRSFFPIVLNQGRLLQQPFWVTGSVQCLNPPPDPALLPPSGFTTGNTPPTPTSTTVPTSTTDPGNSCTGRNCN